MTTELAFVLSAIPFAWIVASLVWLARS